MSEGKGDKLPPLKEEPNQAEIDAEQARILREAAAKRNEESGKK